MRRFLFVVTVGALLGASAPALGAGDDKDWGTIKGRIVWAGEQLPSPPELNVDKDQAHCLSKGKILGEQWVVNKDNKGIRWVFVWLAPDPASGVKELPIHPALKEITVKEVTIDQPCCRFEPHALGMRQGQVLAARNSSTITHNFKYGGHPLRNPGGNPAITAKDQAKIENLKADEKIPVICECSIHGWMKAYIRVFNHPYFAVTDANGNFEIKDAPAGNWRLKIWHETGWRNGAAGAAGEKITIKPGAITDLGNLSMKPN